MARLALLLPNLCGGGAERVALALMKYFLDHGYSVDLLLMKAEGVLLPLVPAAVRIIDLNAVRVRNVIRPLARYLHDEAPVGMQVSMWPLTAAAVLARIASRAQTRLVLSDHAALSKQYADRGLAHRQLLKWSIRFFYPMADARVVVALETASDLSELSGLPRELFKVVYNPVDAPSGCATEPQTYQAWGGSGIRILNVGRLSAQKNHSLLLEAFKRFATEHDARLVILGEGELRDELSQMANALGICDRVSMPGFCLYPAPVYSSADMFVLSSNYEGYPVVLIEAMHCGLPIVSTDCPTGPAEILDRGAFGALVPCGDSERLAQAMVEVLRDPVNSEKLKTRALELTANTADCYLELMTGRPSGPALEGVRSTTPM